MVGSYQERIGGLQDMKAGKARVSINRMNRFYSIVSLMFMCFLNAGGAEPRLEFNRDIRPILSENCFYCHGFDEKNRKAGLRLDTFEGATEDLGGYRAIVLGKASESELLKRISTHDRDDLMPPPETEQSLTEQEKTRLREWINQGAQYQEHWAWSALARSSVPGGVDGAAAIDALLKKGWSENGVPPVVVASPREQLRRLSFDLRGLAPSIDDVRAFEKSPTAKHLATFRDRWMGELSFAEHQALRWLDLVRWADTSGFVSDEPIASGAYRAWIVEAFEKNTPFDQFSIEQLAGDLLPEPTDDQLIASGYNRILNTNCEAGAIEEEQLYKLKGEHIRALGTVWLGMTTGCAECHDHKFDPLSAKDYYSLGAFFDDLVEAGVYTPGDRREPLHYVHGDANTRIRDQELSAEIAALKKQIYSLKSDGFDDWSKSTRVVLGDKNPSRDYIWIPGELPAMRILEGQFDTYETKRGLVRETRGKEGEFVRHHAAELMSGYLHQKALQSDPKTEAWFVDVWIDADARPEMIGIQISHGDYGRLGWKTANYETYYWGKDSSGALDKKHSWSDPKRVKRLGDLPKENGWVRFRVPFDQLLKPVGGQNFEAVGMAWLHTGGRVSWGASGAEIKTHKAVALDLGETGIRRWWETPFNRQVFQSRLEFVPKAVLAKEAYRDADKKAVALAAWQEATQPKLMGRLRSLESELHQKRSQAMPVLVSRKTGDRKVTRLLNRGDYLDKTGPIVEPAVPEFLGKLNTKGLATRLDLARWMFSENKALVSRVFVNRLWHQFFGRGLSDTLEDAGTQGEWPSSVALLDWLAVEFIESGWDRNHMVRLLTSTEAYRLSSKASPELLAKDMENRLHARQGRFRMTAEGIRDLSLQVSGSLKKTTEVPTESFFPYQPDPYWTHSDKVMFGSRHMNWDTSDEKVQYSRSLYTFWKRQNIHPMMLAFDAPTRQECTAKRNITNTPGQALALLNDPIFVEAARLLADKVIHEADGDDLKGLERLFGLTLQREPTQPELELLSGLLTRQRTHYESDLKSALKLVSVGQSLPASDANSPERAAWTIVARTVLNLHEFLTRP